MADRVHPRDEEGHHWPPPGPVAPSRPQQAQPGIERWRDQMHRGQHQLGYSAGHNGEGYQAHRPVHASSTSYDGHYTSPQHSTSYYDEPVRPTPRYEAVALHSRSAELAPYPLAPSSNRPSFHDTAHYDTPQYVTYPDEYYQSSAPVPSTHERPEHPHYAPAPPRTHPQWSGPPLAATTMAPVEGSYDNDDALYEPTEAEATYTEYNGVAELVPSHQQHHQHPQPSLAPVVRQRDSFTYAPEPRPPPFGTPLQQQLRGEHYPDDSQYYQQHDVYGSYASPTTGEFDPYFPASGPPPPPHTYYPNTLPQQSSSYYPPQHQLADIPRPRSAANQHPFAYSPRIKRSPSSASSVSNFGPSHPTLTPGYSSASTPGSALTPTASNPPTPTLSNAPRPTTAGATALSSLSLENDRPSPRLPSTMAFSQVDVKPVIPSTLSSELAPSLQLASTQRTQYRQGSPVLAYNPAREPAAPSKSIVQRAGVKYAVGNVVGPNGSRRQVKAKLAELQATCWTCGDVAAKLIVRGNDVEFHPIASFTCLACLPVETREDEDDEYELKRERDRIDYADTISAAVDLAEGVLVTRSSIITPAETGKYLPSTIKKQSLRCDVCDRIVGAGEVKSALPPPVPSFTVEVICLRCLEKYKPCSDCGGGGGRLTPGRWRCKELFPAGRRTCQLSHARNPPLAEITFEVLPIVDIAPEKVASLASRCRTLYFNTRLRTTARPEMLERADGGATTFQEAEKMTIDHWNLLAPLLSVDIEESRLIRRYVALHSSIPHRRRAKSKKPEPPPEEALEKEVSGFILLEHDLVHGAVHWAVVMPWALSGDSFEATSILGDEAVRKVQADLDSLNSLRVSQNLPPYPNLQYTWGVTPFSKESRMTQSLTRRGYCFLDEYLEMYPDISLDAFPPQRPIHIPNEFIKSFHIYIRAINYDGKAVNAIPLAKKPRPRARKGSLTST